MNPKGAPNEVAESTAVRSAPLEVRERLFELGLDQATLTEAARYGQQFAAECTNFDPPGTPGYVAWAKTIRALRERLVPEGWRDRNDRNYPVVVHPSASHAISVAGGDAYTGRYNRNPATKTEKGPATRDAIAVNQGSFRELDPSFPWPMFDPRERPMWQTWLLLHYRDEPADEVRLELSLPAGINGDGYVTAWSERIILSPIELETSSAPSVEDGGEDIDVPVERKRDQAS